MKEIGGYFELEEFVNNEYYNKLIPLNNGRNALLYILRAKKIKTIYIPYYLCDSISKILEKNGYEFKYYNIDTNFYPIFYKELNEGEYLYVVNFFGQLTEDKILKLKRKFKRIILDNTQAFFQNPINGIDTIYSCRKFFGVPDGAYLSTNQKLDIELEKDISKERMTHILGRYEGIASEYYKNFISNDKLFQNVPLKYMSKLTRNIIGAIDYERVRSKRNSNYSFIDNKLKHRNLLNLVTPDSPFSYPFYVKNGMQVRGILAREKIYVPTLWSNVLKSMPKESLEYKYASNILPLPCDQRYTLVDMEHMLDILISTIN